MIQDLIRDNLCEEGNRLLKEWLEPADADWDVYNPFDHPLAHQRAEEYSFHRWNCQQCLEGYIPTAREMGEPYLVHVETRLQELREMEMA